MYKIYLSKILLCQTPSEISCEIKNRNEEFEAINGLPIYIPKIAGSSKYEFTFYAPLDKSFYQTKGYGLLSDLTAEEINRQIDIWKTRVDQAQIDFVIVRSIGNKTYFPTSDKVALEDCSWRESAERIGWVQYDITLRQFIKQTTQLVNLEQQTDGTYDVTIEQKRERADNREIPDTVTVQRGDTLWAIARKYLNDGEKYRELQKINDIVNPNRLQIGQIIKLR